MPAEMAAKPGTKTRGEDEEVARRRLFKATRLCTLAGIVIFTSSEEVSRM